MALTSPLIHNLRTQLAEVLGRLSELELELGSNNLQLMAKRQRKQELEQQLGAEIKRWYSSRIEPESTHLEVLRQKFIDVMIEEQRLEAVSKANLQSLARLQERLGAYPEIKARGAALRSNVDQLQKMRGQLQLNLMEANLQSERQMNMVVQLDRAEPPGRPAFPIWWLNCLVAVIAGTLAGIGYAFFLNYLEETRNVRTTRLVVVNPLPEPGGQEGGLGVGV